MSRRESLDAVAELAADQWGLFTTAQSRQRGVSANDLARLRSAGAIRTVRHGVYTMPGAPASPLEPVRAEWLATDPGRTVAARSHDDHPVVLCDETAAAVYGMGDFTSTQIHFNAQRRLQTNQEWVHISQRSLVRAEWHLVDGLPVTTPRRTLEDLAASGRWDADHIAAAVRDALTAGLISREDIGRSSTLLAVAPQLATPIGNASVLARLNDDARRRKSNPQHAQGDFFRFMFIHHLMANSPGWVLKGGTGMVCRYRDARSTQDLDLFRQSTTDSVESAEDLALAMTGASIGDYTFVCSSPRAGAGAGSDVARVDVEVLGAGRRVGQFHVDVSAGVTLNRDPDLVWAFRPDNAILPGYPNQIRVRLYPVENQIADKICAMYDTYSGAPSTRYRDLYDLAVLTSNESPDHKVLVDALATQQVARRLKLPRKLVPPSAEWPAQYNRAARRMEGASDRWKDYADAIEQASLVIDPALARLASPDTRIGATEPPGPTVRTDGLTAPWLRTQLIEALSLLADRDWLVTNVGIDGLGSDALSGVLDLLDDTGAVDEPDQQVGAFLLRDEVDHARMLGRALESALGSAPGQWSSVSHAAKALLRQLLHEPGESDR